MKDERLYVVHIQEALRRIVEYTQGGREAFLTDPMTQDAVVRKFEVIGEATKRLSDGTRLLAPDIAWGRLARYRDVLIHQYDRIDLTETWLVIEKQVPHLLEQVEAFLQDLGVPLPDETPPGVNRPSE